MNYRRMGKTGIKLSEISIGAWLTYGRRVEQKEVERILKTAVDAGVNFIDVADIYAKGEAEKSVGAVLGNFSRSDLVLSSKVYWPMSENINDRGLSRKHIFESIDKSLQRLGTDYIDLYFCHRYDDQTEVEETVRAMEDLIRQGKILYWGTSMWSSEQIESAVGQAQQWRAYGPAVEQPQYNMIHREIEVDVMSTCADNGMGLTVWSPLGQGLLTGKYLDGMPDDSRGKLDDWLKKDLTDENLNKVRKLAELASEIGCTPAQLAIAWVLRRPEVTTAITGATRESQLKENLGAADVTIGEDVIEQIETILNNDPVSVF